MGYQAFVTISGQYDDGSWNYIDVLLESPMYDSLDDAERWYDAHHVKPCGFLAMALHANHPELVIMQAEYDIYPYPDNYISDDHFYMETIWWKDAETY